jgi:hypothetical protein
MKYMLIAVLFLITGSKGIAQMKFATLGKPHPVAARLENNSDTLEIMLPLQVHFIRIGKAVYRIVEHEPTIEKVEAVSARMPNIWGSPLKYDSVITWRSPTSTLLYLTKP